MDVRFLLPWFRGDSTRISIGRYAHGIRDALADQIRVSEIYGTHYNLPGPLRRLFPGEAEYRQLPPRWSGTADLIHCMDTWQAIHRRRFSAYPFVATIHDAIPHYMMLGRGPVSAVRLHTFHRGFSAARNATHVIVPSEATRRDLLELLDCDPARVSVVPVIVPATFSPPPPSPGPARVRPPTILSVGTTSDYKNLPLLLHALARPELDATSLIRVGEPLTRAQLRLATELGIAGRIIQLGSIPEDALLCAYRDATVLAQPSLIEGFGMPVAEAMACGLPVVTSDGGALPEVVAGAGVVVTLREKRPHRIDPDDVADFATALATVLSDSEKRKQMRAAGLLRVSEFRPSAVAPRIFDVYRKAVAAH